MSQHEDFRLILAISEEARRSAEETVEQAGRALQRVEKIPGYAQTQVNVRARLSAIPPPSTAFITDRAKVALEGLNIWAEEFLVLVSDTASLNDYISLLTLWERHAWQNFSGYPPEAAIPASDQTRDAADKIGKAVEAWITAAYRRIAGEAKRQSNVSDVTATESLPEILKSLRREARLTVDKVAERLGVTPRSVARHESGESKIKNSNIRAYEDLFTKELKRPVKLPDE
jgi:DNA-binding transcriptional regulator YiaG